MKGAANRMIKVMEKNSVRLALIWIAIYVMLVNIGGIISEEIGIMDSATGVILVLFSLLLLKYLKKNKWIEKFGIRKITKADMQKTLFYLPLVVLALLQFVNGIKSPLSSVTLLTTCLLMIGVGFVEELIFRGFLLEAIWNKSGMNRAVVISGITFGFGHFINLFRGYGYVDLLTQILTASVIGIVLALLVAITKNIVPGILFHIVFNISGTLSNEVSGLQEIYTLLAILVICAGYLVYLVKTMKNDERQ